MSAPPFGFVALPATRSTVKPRARGLTMMIDNGLPTGFHRDLLETAGEYIDFAKFKTGTARLYRQEHLRRKLAQCAEHGVKPFIGGQFHEYVFAVYGTAALPQ